MGKLKYWGFLLGLLVWGMSVATTTVRADALDEVPAKALNLDGLFEVGQFDKNSASKIAVTKSNGEQAHVFELNHDNNQVGAIWSTPVNRFNMNVDNKITMWVNLAASEGLALVLQNDPRKTAAISRFGTKNIIGENLGVYGTDTYHRKTAPATIAKTAIQKSWALEIDTKVNNGGFLGFYQRGNSFDEKMHKNHLASIYPAAPETYTQRGGLTTAYHFEQNHQAAQERLKVNSGQWYPVKLTWSAKNKTMSYSFDGGPVKIFQIDTQVFGKSFRNLTWGVTSTATANNARALVAFETLPHPIEVESDLNVRNLTQALPVYEGSWVHGGDELEYEYVLSYLSGDNDWQRVEANLALPAHVAFSEANIRYEDGHEEVVGLPEDGEKAAERIQHSLSQALSVNNRHACITLKGETERVTQDTKVADDISYFVGHEKQSDAPTPYFTITTGKSVGLTVEPIKPVKKGEGATVKGQIRLNDESDFDNEGMRVEVKLNGERLEDYLLDPDEAAGYVELDFDPEELNESENELVLRARSKDNAVSDPVTVTVLVLNGELRIKSYSENSTFETVKLSGATQISRPQDMQLVIVDETGSNNKWRLDVAATEFKTAQGAKLAGGLYYHDGEQMKPVTENNAQVVVEKRTNVGEDYHVTKDWSAQQGLMIQTSPEAIPGQYQSTIKWTLNSVPGK
ncbi:hypothetical protein EFP00_05600 [Lactiplantibacillus paraplantarum]|uniref:lectin-like domain-containing protein n=1 Tax=Lactiplantibacillus paraplantarum TaxID=60520 RepID=UPI0021A277A3|nr:hypothetical protein [Lactiplantibacillus paraplantarum]